MPLNPKASMPSNPKASMPQNPTTKVARIIGDMKNSPPKKKNKAADEGVSQETKITCENCGKNEENCNC